MTKAIYRKKESVGLTVPESVLNGEGGVAAGSLSRKLVFNPKSKAESKLEMRSCKLSERPLPPSDILYVERL